MRTAHSLGNDQTALVQMICQQPDFLHSHKWSHVQSSYVGSVMSEFRQRSQLQVVIFQFIKEKDLVQVSHSHVTLQVGRLFCKCQPPAFNHLRMLILLVAREYQKQEGERN